MRMKMFSADTLEQARADIAAEFGNDAIILSERVTDEGVEIRAAVDRSPAGRMPEPQFAPRPEVEREAAMAGLKTRITEVLVWHGAHRRFAEMVARSAANLSRPDTDARQALAAGLEDVVACAPLPALPERNLILVGPPGAGRTATAAKLCRRASMARQNLMPVAADFDATAGGQQLSAYLEREQHLITIAADPGALFAALKELELAAQRCVIDLPAINPFDEEDLARLADLLGAIRAEPLLVLSAEGHPEDLAEAASAYAGIGVKRAILTKLDAVRRRGGAFAAVAGAGISLSHLAVTPFIGGGLVPAAPGRLATLLIEEAPGEERLKGAA